MEECIFYFQVLYDGILYRIKIRYNSDTKIYRLIKQASIDEEEEYEYFSNSKDAMKRALQLIGVLIRNYEVKIPITSINDLRQEYAMLEEVSRIRKDIFESYEKTYLKPLNRTTWSNWMNGQDPDAVKKNIIENAIAKYNGRIKIQDITSNE